MTSFIKIGKSLGNSWYNLVKETHVSGTLKSVAVAGGPIYHHFQIKLDGKLLVDAPLSGSLGDNLQNNSITINLDFEESVEVNIRGVPNGSNLATYWVVYIINSSNRQGEREEKLIKKDGNILSKIRYGNYKANEEDVFLIGPSLRSSISLENNFIFPDEDIHGRITLTDHEGNIKKLDHVKIISRVMGTDRIIGEPITIRDVSENTPFTMRNPRYFLDEKLLNYRNIRREPDEISDENRRRYFDIYTFYPFKFEISADIKESENIPAQVILL